MATRVNSTSDFWITSEDDVLNNGKTGATQTSSTKNIVYDPESGLIQTQVSIDGDLRQISGTSHLTLDPSANSSGSATTKFSPPFLLRWVVKSLQTIASKFDNPIAVSGELSATLDPTGLSTELKQDGIISALGLPLLIDDTSPISVTGNLTATLDSTGLSTEAKQDALITAIGTQADTPATSSIGSFSFISLFKLLMAHLLQPRTAYGVLLSTVGDNIVLPAINATTEYVVTGLRIQASTASITTVLIKKGISDVNPLRLRTVADATGLSEVYGFSDAIRCGGNNAFVLNFSAANAHGVSVIYYTVSTSTGLPT